MFRSEPLRRLMATMACRECGVIGESQAAHSNLGAHGKGRSIKASDAAAMPLCASQCHRDLDAGSQMTPTAKEHATYRYIASTYIELVETGMLVISDEGRRRVAQYG